MLPKEIEDLLNVIPSEYQVLIRPIFMFYEGKIEKLEARIKELEDQISKNSRNSSKPPSTDEYDKPAPKSRRKKRGRKAGGQKGHDGHTLKMVSSPDIEQRHKVEVCSCCQSNLRNQPADAIDRRQVYDIPPLALQITEHQVEIKRCSCGYANRADFPPGVKHYVQYGPNLKSLLVYMQDYQLIPYQRTKEFVQDIFGHHLSTGTLYNIRQHAFDQLATFENRLIALLKQAAVAGFDETGIRIKAQRRWLHSCSTAHHVYYAVHAKRGKQAMNQIGILPHFTGVAVHDFWKSYYHYKSEHSLCNAHLLRELIFIKERFKQQWASQLCDLLLNMKNAKQRAMDQGKSFLSPSTLARYRRLYDAIVQRGLKVNPFKPPAKKQKGRPKKSKPRNLLERLSNYADDILRFFYDFRVPFDNNFSERDIRMMKVKQKISGCFRSWNGAQFFTRTRSFIGTARKQNINVFNALRNLFIDNTIALKLTQPQLC